MTDQQILHIFIEVACDRRRAANFLLNFAQSVVSADTSNFALVRPVALLLIEKYGLEKYLDNYEATR